MTQPTAVPIAKLTHEIGRGTLTSLIAEGLAVPVGLLLAALLSRSLGPEAYGRYGLAVTAVLAVEYLLAAATSRATMQLLSDPGQLQAGTAPAIRLHLFTGLAIALVLYAIARPAGALLGSGDFASDLRWLSLDVPFFSLAQAQRSILAAKGNYTRRSVSISIRWLARLGATAALLPLGVFGAILAWPVSSLADLLLTRALPMRGVMSGWSLPRRSWSRTWPQLLWGAGQRSLERSDLLILQGAGAPASATGLYVAAQNLAILPSLFGSALTPILLSAMTRERAAGREADSRESAELVLGVTLNLLPAAVLFGVCGNDFAVAAFGSDFSGAGQLTGFLVAGATGVALLAASSAILTSQGRQGVAAALSMGFATAAAIAQFSAIRFFGSLGAAVITMAGGLLAGTAGVALLYRGWRRPFPIAMFARSIVATGVTGVAAVFLPSSLWWPARAALLSLAACLALAAWGGDRLAFRRKS